MWDFLHLLKHLAAVEDGFIIGWFETLLHFLLYAPINIYFDEMSVYFQPKLHAINHGTTYCGRETLKALLVLLDEEAANLPTENKAELLYGDENVTTFGITSVLTLFR